MSSEDENNSVADMAPVEGHPPSQPLQQDSGAPDGAKLRQIFAGARGIFLRDGYDGASMNDIARAAGVSKGTLYAYFDGKARLFEALVRSDRQRLAEQICRFDQDYADVADVLRRFGHQLLSTMLQPEQVAFMRMVIGIVGKLPGTGQAVNDAGPQYAADRLAVWLAAQTQSGALDVADPPLAAHQFIELCKAGVFTRCILGAGPLLGRDEVGRNVEAALDVFLHYYRRRVIGRAALVTAFDGTGFHETTV